MTFWRNIWKVNLTPVLQFLLFSCVSKIRNSDEKKNIEFFDYFAFLNGKYNWINFRIQRINLLCNFNVLEMHKFWPQIYKKKFLTKIFKKKNIHESQQVCNSEFGKIFYEVTFLVFFLNKFKNNF